MVFEWDEQKRQINIRKHGIDFVGCEAVFANETTTTIDDRHDYGEDRLVTIGLLDGRVVIIAHTETATTIRVISIRKATKREEFLFFERLKD